VDKCGGGGGGGGGSSSSFSHSVVSSAAAHAPCQCNNKVTVWLAQKAKERVRAQLFARQVAVLGC
jgi:hypothetical protein